MAYKFNNTGGKNQTMRQTIDWHSTLLSYCMRVYLKIIETTGPLLPKQGYAGTNQVHTARGKPGTARDKTGTARTTQGQPGIKQRQGHNRTNSDVS